MLGMGASPCVNDRGWVWCALSSVLCSMLFLRNYNYYIYLPNGTSFPPIGTPLPPPVAAATTCCKYHFPVWAPDSYRVANASFGGTTTINGVKADYWRFQYTCPWTTPQPSGPWPQRLPAVTVQRDLWTTAGGATPVRMNETLTSGYTDFLNVHIGPQDTARVFDGFVNQLNCIESGDTGFDATCNRYNAQGRLGYLGYD